MSSVCQKGSQLSIHNSSSGYGVQNLKKENKCSNFLDYKVIGQEVRNRRLAKGYTQKDLAKKIGTTYQVILQYEKGTRRISIKKLYELAEALSTTARDLACGQEVSNEERYEEEEILNLVLWNEQMEKFYGSAS